MAKGLKRYTLDKEKIKPEADQAHRVQKAVCATLQTEQSFCLLWLDKSSKVIKIKTFF